jgi:DNA-binding CsgD family transcriptional regulator
VISLYRADRAAPYSERDRATMELLVPHLVASMRQARLDDLRRATHVHLAHAPAAAIVNRRGIVLEAEPRFIDMLTQQYPDFHGPSLPTPLAFLGDVTEPVKRVIGRLRVRADVAADLVLVHARAALPIDTLTDREREVASSFASGLSTKEIAEALGIATNTVRVHVTRIYAKLGVMNKAELASMLAGLD